MSLRSAAKCTLKVEVIVPVNIGESVGLVQHPSSRRIGCPAELDEGGRDPDELEELWPFTGQAVVLFSSFATMQEHESNDQTSATAAEWSSFGTG